MYVGSHFIQVITQYYKTYELFQNVNHMPVAYNTFIVQSTLS